MIIIRQRNYSTMGALNGFGIGGSSGLLVGKKIGEKIGKKKALESYDPGKAIEELETEIIEDEKRLKELEKNKKETNQRLKTNYSPENDPDEYRRSIEYKKKQIEKIKKNPESGRKDYAAKHYDTKYEKRGGRIGGVIGGTVGGLVGYKI